MDQWIENMDGQISIYVKDLTQNKILYAKDMERIIPTASTIKTLILVNAMEQVEAGKLSLDQPINLNLVPNVPYGIFTHMTTKTVTLHDVLLFMMCISDNLATNLSIAVLGMENINATAKRLGLHNLKLQRVMMDFEAAERGLQNIGTPQDLCDLAELIYKGSAANAIHTKLIEDLMSTGVSHDIMTRSIPEEVKVVHKTGGLDRLNHDVGVVYLDHVDYLIGIFLTEVENNIVGCNQIDELAKNIYEEMSKGEK